MRTALMVLVCAAAASAALAGEPEWLPDIWNVKAVYQVVKSDFALNAKKPEKPYAFEFLADGKTYIRIDGKRRGEAFAWEFKDGRLFIIQGGKRSEEQLDLIDDDLLMMYEQNPGSSSTMMLILAREKKN